MSAALRHALKQVQQEAPQLARSVRTSAGPRYHYVSATCRRDVIILLAPPTQQEGCHACTI